MLTPGTELGPYEIIAPIGAGGMGEVYRAHDSRTGRDVAIKISAEQFSERFSREVHAVAALNHPNICTLYDVGPNYLVLELVEGPTLAEYLGRVGQVARAGLPLDKALPIARQIADALDAAHDKGIVHRDLKPANIKVKSDGVVKVLDFGLARIGTEQAGESADLTNSPTFAPLVTGTGVILGTAAYMAPEQARGQVADKRADIWAFGVILFEMLSGRRLFEGDTASDTLASVLKEEPNWNAVPTAARPLLRRCLEKDPKRRLRDIGDAMPLLDFEAASPRDQPRERRRSALLAWATAGILLAVASAIAVVHFREKALSTPDAVRFEIPLPPAINRTLGLTFSISPDGRRLASLGFGLDGRYHFHIRALDALEIREVPDIDLALGSAFFWSPDSRFLAFEADGKLRSTDLSGGAARVVCDLPGRMLGGSWNRDDVIVFGVDGRGVMRVAAGGGSPSPVTKVDPARKETSHIGPTFLADGRHFIYGRGTYRSGSEVPVFVGSIDVQPDQQDSRELLTTRMTQAGLGLAFASASDRRSGHVLYLRGRSLLAQPFDVANQRLLGNGVPLVEASDAGFSVSATGVLVSKASGAQNYQLAWIDRQGRTLETIGEPGPYSNGVVSPDGRKAAVFKVGNTDASDLWLVDLVRGTSSPLTFNGTSAITAAWSPDSKQLAFGLQQAPAFGILHTAIDGARGVETSLNADRPVFPTAWSPDRRFILYCMIGARTKQDIAALSLTDKPVSTMLLNTEYNEFPTGFSPDGRWMTYFSYESGRSEVYARPFLVESGSPSLGSKTVISKGGGFYSWWRSDGRELFYNTFTGSLMSVAVTPGATLTLGEPVVVLNALEGALYGFDPEGKRLLVAKPVALPAAPPFNVVLNWQNLLKGG